MQKSLIQDRDKSKEQLISELEEQRLRISKLETSLSQYEQAKLLPTIKKNRALYEYIDAFLSNLPVGIAALDTQDFRYMEINQKLADINGMSVEDHIGKPIAEILPDLAGEILPMLEEVLRTGKPTKGYEFSRRLPGDPDKLDHFIRFVFPIMNKNENPIALGAVVIDNTERKQAEEVLRKNGEFFVFLNKITLDMLHYQDTNSLFQSIINHASKIIEAPHVELSFVEDDELVVQATTGSPEFLGERVTREEATLSWKAIDTATTVVIDDYSQYPGRRDIYDPIGIKAVASFPIVFGQDSLGVLDISRLAQGDSFSSDNIQQGKVFSQLIAVILNNNRLSTAVSHELEQRKHLLAIEKKQRKIANALTNACILLTSTLDTETILLEILIQVQNIVPYKTANIMLLDKGVLHMAAWKGYDSIDKEEYADTLVHPIDKFPLVEEIVWSQQSLTLSDTHGDPRWIVVEEWSWIRSWIGVPIVYRENVLGILHLDSDVINKFSDIDGEYLQPLANAAAVALWNSQLFEQLQNEIVERERIQSKFDQERELLRTLIDAVPDYIFVKDTEGRFLISNRAHTAASDVQSPSQIVGKVAKDIFPGTLAFQFHMDDMSVIETGQSLVNQERLTVGEDGRNTWVLTTKVPFYNFNKEIVGLVGISRDITQRKTIEDSLMLVHRIGAQIASMLDLQLMLDLAVQLLHESFSYDAIGIHIIEGDKLILKAQAGSEHVFEKNSLQTREGFLGHEDSEEKKLTIKQLFQQSNNILFNNGQSYLSYPLYSQGKILGVIDVRNSDIGGFSDDDEMLIGILADQLSIGIQNANLFVRVKEGEKRLKTLAQQTLSSQEAERQHLSRELHDEIGQSMVGIKISLNMLVNKLSSKSPGILDQFKDISNLIDKTMMHIRVVAQGLRPPSLDTLGLETTLEGYCYTLARRANLEINYSIQGKSLTLSESVSICLYRVLQEGLTNIIKHANATKIEVILDYLDNYLELTIIDNGKGFDVETLTKLQIFASSIGLIGMKERLELLDGTLEIISHLGQGTQLKARIPGEDFS